MVAVRVRQIHPWFNPSLASGLAAQITIRRLRGFFALLIRDKVAAAVKDTSRIACKLDYLNAVAARG